MDPKITILGTGRLGSAVARAFLERSYPTTIYNRTREKCAPLVAAGARAAASAKEAVAEAQVVFSVLSDYRVTEALLREPGVLRALSGKLLVQFASGSPRTARELAALAKQHGIDYLDGAVMATPNFIGQPGCTILYSGPSALFSRNQELLSVLGDNAQLVGEDPGHASALDSALLVYMWGALFGILQGSVICEAEGIPLQTFSRQLGAVMPVLAHANQDLVERVRTRRYAADEGTLAALAAHHGGFAHLLEICRAHRLPAAFPEAMAKVMDVAMARGHAQDDFAVLHAFMQPGRA
jgi:3-hydroxyisobutyrate dehydrogenase-like beta-hydroxyacid dehydrogenase